MNATRQTSIPARTFPSRHRPLPWRNRAGKPPRRWNSYTHIDILAGTSHTSGHFVDAVNPDAFGNTLQSWSDGLLATPQAAAGWGHNTKENDGGTGLVYMYQRWYLPHTGTFLSQAPYPPMMEHEYGFAEGDPVMMVDVKGAKPVYGSNIGPPTEPQYERRIPEECFEENRKRRFRGGGGDYVDRMCGEDGKDGAILPWFQGKTGNEPRPFDGYRGTYPSVAIGRIWPRAVHANCLFEFQDGVDCRIDALWTTREELECGEMKRWRSGDYSLSADYF